MQFLAKIYLTRHGVCKKIIHYTRWGGVGLKWDWINGYAKIVSD